tara:strand:- start:1364 stop:2080 length:717 start_codon:yes stop_codon:yes gene_type:complete
MKKNILILGGSSDIGIEVIKKLVKNANVVYAHFSNNKKALKNLKSKELKIIQSNFEKINEKNIRDILFKKFNFKFDIIINLIGYIDNKGFGNTNLGSIIKSLKINAVIPSLIIQKSLNNMLKNNWGRILNCSSVGVKFGGGKNSYNYSLSKHCMEFIPSNFKNWAKKNVTINNLRIGVTDTKIHRKMKRGKKFIKNRIKLIPANRMASPQEIADFIINLTTKNTSFITGQTINISGGE